MQKEKSFIAGQPSEETGGIAQLCLPDELLSGVFIVEVGSKTGRGLGNDWWKVRGGFRSPLCRCDCPSCRFMSGMCNIGRVPYVTLGRFSAYDVQIS